MHALCWRCVPIGSVYLSPNAQFGLRFTEPIGTHRQQSAFIKGINSLLADNFMKGLLDADSLPKGFDEQHIAQVHSFFKF